MSEEMRGPTSTPAVLIGIGQFRGDTRNYVRRALAGETFTVTRRGRLIAELRSAKHVLAVGNTRISLAVVRTRASWFLDRVAAGEVIVIEQRGEPIAALHPCST
jgi:antitoxin (DNA-binding transcriptional repressor) of toxin-antitoxin stability system